MIIGITGPIASGKSVLVEMLVEKGFIYHSLSDEVREEANKLGIGINRKALQDLGNAMREKFGDGYWAERIVSSVKSGKNHVVDGIRNPGEIEVMKKLGNFILIGVDAPIEKRCTWIMNRNKDSDPKTFEEIKAIDARDRGVGEKSFGQNSAKCYAMADVYLKNDGSFEELSKKIGDLLETLKC